MTTQLDKPNVGDYFYDQGSLYWVVIKKVWVYGSTTYVTSEVIAVNGEDAYVGEVYEDTLRFFQELLEKKTWVPVSKEMVDNFQNNWDML